MKKKQKCVFLGWSYKGEKEVHPIEEMPDEIFYEHFIKPINKMLGINLKLKR